MMPDFSRLAKTEVPFSPWLIGPVVAVLLILILLRTKKRALGAIGRHLSGRTSWICVESLLHAMSPALTVAIMAAGLALLKSILPLPTRIERTADVILAGAVILALVIFADRICRHLLARLVSKAPALQTELTLLQGGARGSIIGLGLLAFLDSIGISITPVLASLGIGTLAVALALQDTLTNLFAGIYMIAEKANRGWKLHQA